LFGGTHFIGGDPTKDDQKPGKGEQIYGLSSPIKDIETPWAKPQKYDAPWYEDVWNGIKDFGVGLVQDVASLVGFYGEDGWGWQGWDGLGQNWENFAGGIVGLVGFYGPDGWGWQGWGNLGDNWLNLVNAFVPYREWDGGNGAGYVITQSVLNIGSIFLAGSGVVKGVIKAGKAGRALKGVEGLSNAAKAGIVGRELLAGFKESVKLPSVANLKATLDNIKFKFDDLRGLNKALEDAGDFKAPDTNLPDTNVPDNINVPDKQPVHVGAPNDHVDTGGTGHGGDHNGHQQGGDSGGSHGGNDGPKDPPNNGHTDPNNGHTDPNTDPNNGHTDPNTDPNNGHTDPNTGHTDPNNGHTDPNNGHDPHHGQPDPDTQKKLDRADRLEQNLRDGGLTGDQIDRLRGDLPRDSREWQRLASALEQGFGKKVKGLLHPKAVDFALDGGRTVNPETFAHRYEYFKARFDELQAQVREQIANGGLKLNNKSVAQEAAERLGDLDLKAELKADLDAVHTARPHPASVDPNLSGPDLENAVRSNAGDIDMGSDTSAAYHVRKHYDELPGDEITGNPTRDYFDSAQRTIHDGEVWKREALPGGAERLIFRREVVDAAGNRKLMEAIVIARPDGKLIMATYGAAKAG
jgi:hypothetical protein